jgi:uncharacterized phage infection (PIP) family protein YhgE
VERIHAETRARVDEAVSQARQAQELAERVKAELQGQVQEMVTRIERSAGNSQEIVKAAQEASEEVRRAAERVAESASSVDAAVALAQRAAEEAKQAAERIDQGIGAVTAAVAGAQQAAEEAKRAAEQPQADVSLQDDTRSLIARLEEDYQLLTSLVQELSIRLGSLTQVAAEQSGDASVPTSQEEELAPFALQTQPEPPSPWLNEAPGPSPQEEPGVSAWAAAEAEDATFAPNAQLSPEAEEVASEPPAEAHAEAAEPAETEVGGLIEVTISPVPDFDRLLTLDGALGKLQGVSAVALINYAQDEVTFRVQLEGPRPVSRFADDLSEASGIRVRVSAAADTSLRLHLE